MDSAKLSVMRLTDFISVADFTGLIPSATASKPTFTVGAGTILTNCEIGLSADSASATVEGGSGVTAERVLTTSSPVGTPTITSIAASAGTLGGAGKLTEIGTTGIVGLAMTVAGDDVRHFMRVPTYWDRKQPVRVRFAWATEAADTDTVTWKFMYDLVKANDGTNGVITTPATVLDTVLVADAAIGTAKTFQTTEWGLIARNKLTDGYDWWSILCELDAATVTIVSEITYFLGVEFEYTPRWSNAGGPGPEGRPWLP